MTKHWGGQGSLAPPAIPYLPSSGLGAHRDHQLDFAPAIARAHNAHRSRSGRSVARTSLGQYWHPHPYLYQEPGARLGRRAPALVMEKEPPRDPGSGFYTAAQHASMEPPAKHRSHHAGARSALEQDGGANQSKKKNYQRYPKPPYSYLAMIAMVIQNSPEKKLTLSEILKEISTLFPFFKGNYKGWRDSVRHNLSSYDCFVKVLKDPGKPQGKGNFWAVEVGRVPLELLKRQNTAVSRQDETIFAQDLAPYILHGHTPAQKSEVQPPSPPLLPTSTRNATTPPEDLFRPKLDSSFAIDSLLHSLRPASTPGEGLKGRDSWGLEATQHSTRPLSPPRPRYSSSNRSVSASSASPASSSSDEDWRLVSRVGKRLNDGQAGSDCYADSGPPSSKLAKRGSAPPWELPTSYAKYTPPNAVAPPSMRFNGGPFVPMGGLPFYSYGGPPVTPGHFVGHAYWPLLPSGPMTLQGPPLLMDLDSMLQSVPPNKSVFDVLGPSSQMSHQLPNQYSLQNGPPLSRYPQY